VKFFTWTETSQRTSAVAPHILGLPPWILGCFELLFNYYLLEIVFNMCSIFDFKNLINNKYTSTKSGTRIEHASEQRG
jgi:hypothetical protein